MNNQKAIEWLKEQQQYVTEMIPKIIKDNAYGGGDPARWNKLYKAYPLAIEALQKQIPTKPIIKPWSPALCPCCSCELSESIGDGYYKHYVMFKFCECGQKLDWE